MILWILLGFILCVAFTLLVCKIIKFGMEDDHDYMMGDHDFDEGDRK